MTPMDENQIFKKVQECLAGALGLSAEEIRPESSLVRDLGAESIDFIDILFRLEKTFDLKIPSGELFPGNVLNQEGLVSGGRVTPEGLKVLREKLPFLDLNRFEKEPLAANLPALFTVGMIADYVRERVSRNISSSS